MTSYSLLLLLAYSPVAAVTSLGSPFSDWLNETVSKMRLNLLLNNVSSVNGSIEIHGEQQVQQLVAQLVWQHVASVKALLRCQGFQVIFGDPNKVCNM